MKKIILLSILILLLISFKSEASNTRYWFSPGIGGGSHGLSLGFDFTLKPGNAIISFNYINNTKDAFDILGPEPQESATEYGVLFGLSTTQRGGALASLAIGFGSTLPKDNHQCRQSFVPGSTARLFLSGFKNFSEYQQRRNIRWLAGLFPSGKV